MLSAVLANTPSEWEEADYKRKLYYVFDLNERDREYMSEISKFERSEPRLSVDKIQRVQNPFQYGRFLVRKEQLLSRGKICKVVKYYHPIQKNDLDTALEFNMDVRRYTSETTGYTSDYKNPLFYNDPGYAYRSCYASEKIILICNVLCDSSEGARISKSNDTEYMPTYIVKLI